MLVAPSSSRSIMLKLLYEIGSGLLTNQVLAQVYPVELVRDVRSTGWLSAWPGAISILIAKPGQVITPEPKLRGVGRPHHFICCSEWT